MKPQQAMEITQPAKAEKATEAPIFVEAEKLIERVEEAAKSVAKRAYEFFEARGYRFGNELEDWFRAESELLRPVPVTLKEGEAQITLQAEVPGFQAGDIKISAEPQRLIIEGCSEQTNEEKSEEAPEKVVLSERRTNRFYRLLDLPAEIDPARAAANLKDGVLKITLPKTATREAVGVEVKSA
jgi:HSP20 family protein